MSTPRHILASIPLGAVTHARGSYDNHGSVGQNMAPLAFSSLCATPPLGQAHAAGRGGAGQGGRHSCTNLLQTIGLRQFDTSVNFVSGHLSWVVVPLKLLVL